MAQQDFAEVQAAELEVLKAIFMEDLEEVQSKTAWKSVNAAHEFRISVKPSDESMWDKVGVKIRFKLPSKYPRIVPTILCEEAKGLTASQLAGLKASLQSLATSLVGTEMVFELVQTASEYISSRHDGLLQTSLEEQRLAREMRSAEAEAAATLAEREAQRQASEAEATRLQGLIDLDVKAREEQRLDADKKEKELEAERERFANEFEDTQGSGGKRLKMRMNVNGAETMAVVSIGLGGRDDRLGTVIPVEISAEGCESQSATAHVYHIAKPYFVTPQGKRKLAKVESDLIQVRNLRHPHITRMCGALLTRYLPSLTSNSAADHPLRKQREGWTLTVVTEALNCSTLDDLLSACGNLHAERVLSYALQLARAVETMHVAGVIHRSIRPRLIFVLPAAKDGKGLSNTEVKLGGASWYQRLVDLNKSDPWRPVVPEPVMPDAWTCPRAISDPFLYDKSRDMWELGVVVAQMLYGLDVWQRFSSPMEFIHDTNKIATVGSQLSKALAELFVTDDKKRASATKLVNMLKDSSSKGGLSSNGSHSSLKTLVSTPKLSHPPLSSISSSMYYSQASVQTPGGSVLSKSVDAPTGFFWQPRQTTSRYRTEFEELEFLGRGGGGQVVKARNTLDGHLYAIKKIKLPNDPASEAKLLREVTIWSRMNHPNIVRYHTSWVEIEEPAQDGRITELDSERESSLAITNETGTTEETQSTASGSDTDSDDGEGGSSNGDAAPFDFVMDDFDDVDFLSASHSKNVSYPSIHFGNEDDPSAPPSTHNNSPERSKNASRVGTPVLNRPRTLYIQMEYVEKLTLKEAIEDGIDEIDSWRMMSQILSAMLHFTSINIIHRDLKPSNIFIDVKGNVRIGDFGLAVNQGLPEPADATNLSSLASSMDEADLTSGVGTSLYIAPESLARGKVERSVKYSNKIDMYSLGIVFFELWHPFRTGMERINVLRDLRKPEIVFPSTWNFTKLERHTEIIRRCLTHDPERRASPRDLLDSGLLPLRVGDDAIEEAIRLLSHSGNAHAQKLLNALFHQTTEESMRKDFAYDFYDGLGARLENDPFMELVRERLSRIFRKKGAVYADSPLLIPQSDVFGARNSIRLLNIDGTITCLPFQINLPFCRMIARDTRLARMKRWSIGHVYQDSVAGGQPRGSLRASFDIVSDAVTAAAEAEVIYVLDEIMSAFPFTGQKVHVISHAFVLDALLEHFPEPARPAVLDTLVRHDPLNRSWTKTVAELLKIEGVTDALLKDFASINISADFKTIRAKLERLPWGRKKMAEGLDAIQDVIQLCEQAGVTNIKVAPFLAKNYDIHRGSIFFETHHIKGKLREVIASGGRFDDIVTRLSPPDLRFSNRMKHVVGASIAIAQLNAAVAEANASFSRTIAGRSDSDKTYGPWAVRRCDVYVVSYGAGQTGARLEVAKDLWRAGISCDLMYDDDLLNLSPERLVTNCRREGILYLVFVKAAKTPTLRIKNVLKGDETDVARSQLVSKLQDELKEVPETSTAEVPETHQHDSPAAEREYHIVQGSDVKFKGKVKQRHMTLKKATERIHESVLDATAAPVFAVDIDGITFRKMCQSSSWITDDDTYRGIVDSAAPSFRSYISSIRHEIRAAQQSTPSLKCLWLFSPREDRASLLMLDEA